MTRSSMIAELTFQEQIFKSVPLGISRQLNIEKAYKK